jgi:hypothetical protein
MSKIMGMTMEEVERATIIGSLAEGHITSQIAATRLGVTTRQVRRLVMVFRAQGADGLVSKQRGKASNRQLDPVLAQEVLVAVREQYADFGPTLACEKLFELDGLKLSKEALRQLMIRAGLWHTREERKAALHQLRAPRACLGELVQIDGSSHAWFEGRGPACTLLVFVDDATGRILQLHFATTESTSSYMVATKKYVVQHGRPMAFYADKAAVFRHPTKCQTETQFHRAVNELGIKLICANSPEAKGRVERMNKTLQDRLVKEMRLDGISTIEAANAWSEKFILSYNLRFAVVARNPLDLHRRQYADEKLDVILTWQERRKLTRSLSLQYGSKTLIVRDSDAARRCIGRYVKVHTFNCGKMEIRSGQDVLAYTTMAPRIKASRPVEVDGKSIDAVLDQHLHKSALPIKKQRVRAYRNPTSSEITKGVQAAKAASKNIKIRVQAQPMTRQTVEKQQQK